MKFTENQTILQYVKAHNIFPKKQFGQNFLIEETVYQDIIDAAHLTAEDHVIEVGPGLGTLSMGIAPLVKQLTLVEKDTDLIPHLEHVLADYHNIDIHNADILDFPIPSTPYKVVANIPYYITSPIIFKFLKSPNPPTTLVLLMQKEVAQKIVTQGKGSSVLSISVQAYGTPTLLRDVAAGCFYPAPKVTSSLLEIVPHTTPRITSELKDFEKVVKMSFASKRKKLTHNLHAGFHLSKELSRQLLTELDIDPDTRPELLTVEQWDQLTQKVLEHAPSGK